jgi:hypothetical protein
MKKEVEKTEETSSIKIYRKTRKALKKISLETGETQPQIIGRLADAELAFITAEKIV